MNVKKIFVLLITIVALVAIGALILNVLLPNASILVVDTIENMIYKATGLQLDWNNNGAGANGSNATLTQDNSNSTTTNSTIVDGYN